MMSRFANGENPKLFDNLWRESEEKHHKKLSTALWEMFSYMAIFNTGMFV